MTENINLQVEKENLDAAFSVLGTQLKVYATAKINYEKAKVGRFSKDVIEAFNNMNKNISSYIEKQAIGYQKLKYERQLAKQEKERQERILEAEKLQEEQRKEMTEQRKADMEYALKQDRKLNFKNGIIQKTGTLRSKLGRVKSAVLEKVMTRKSNFDLKVENAFVGAQVAVTGFVATGVEKVNDTKKNISKYTTAQIEKYQSWKYERQLAKQERERQERILEAEKLQEEQRKEMTEQRKEDMEYALQQAERQQLNNKNKELIEKLREEKERLVSGVNTLINNNEQTEEIITARSM